MWEIAIQLSLAIVFVACLTLCSWRRKKHGYNAIPDEENVSDRLTRDKEFQKLALKEALCQFFLNLSPKYTFVEQLEDIGCRLGRSWFIVKELKSDKKLLVLTKKSSDCVLSLTPTTIELLRSLFEPLSKHPYIYPITDVDLLAQKPFVFVVEPFQKKGTLKDLIYKQRPREEWSGKYRVQGKGLSVLEIKAYGKQILEAISFLHNKGIPTNGHIHSGNIFIIKGICRISGYEQAILGFKSRLYPRLSKMLKNNKYAIDTLCFGHLLYEMSYGQELFDAKPGKLHFEFCSRSPEVGEILKFVFGAEESPYPDIQDILYHRFFQDADSFYQIDPDSIFFKPQVTRCILKPFKKYFKKMRKKSRKDHEEVGIEAEESPSQARSPSLRKSKNDADFTVSYEATTEQVSSPILNRRSAHPSSSPDIPYSPERTISPPYSPTLSQKRETRSQTEKKTPTLYGVDALMASIKQAIQQRHDVLEHSDEHSSRASSFSSTSPPPSSTLPSKQDLTRPLLPQKPPPHKPPVPPKSASKPPLQKKPSQSPHPNGHMPPPPVPKKPPPPPQVKPDVKYRPSKSRSALINSIEGGTKLRKTVSNDRSAPRF